MASLSIYPRAISNELFEDELSFINNIHSLKNLNPNNGNGSNNGNPNNSNNNNTSNNNCNSSKSTNLANFQKNSFSNLNDIFNFPFAKTPLNSPSLNNNVALNRSVSNTHPDNGSTNFTTNNGSNNNNNYNFTSDTTSNGFNSTTLLQSNEDNNNNATNNNNNNINMSFSSEMEDYDMNPNSTSLETIYPSIQPFNQYGNPDNLLLPNSSNINRSNNYNNSTNKSNNNSNNTNNYNYNTNNTNNNNTNYNNFQRINKNNSYNYTNLLVRKTLAPSDITSNFKKKNLPLIDNFNNFNKFDDYNDYNDDFLFYNNYNNYNSIQDFNDITNINDINYDIINYQSNSYSKNINSSLNDIFNLDKNSNDNNNSFSLQLNNNINHLNEESFMSNIQTPNSYSQFQSNDQSNSFANKMTDFQNNSNRNDLHSLPALVNHLYYDDLNSYSLSPEDLLLEDAEEDDDDDDDDDVYENDDILDHNDIQIDFNSNYYQNFNDYPNYSNSITAINSQNPTTFANHIDNDSSYQTSYSSINPNLTNKTNYLDSNSTTNDSKIFNRSLFSKIGDANENENENRNENEIKIEIANLITDAIVIKNETENISKLENGYENEIENENRNKNENENEIENENEDEDEDEDGDEDEDEDENVILVDDLNDNNADISTDAQDQMGIIIEGELNNSADHQLEMNDGKSLNPKLNEINHISQIQQDRTKSFDSQVLNFNPDKIINFNIDNDSYDIMDIDLIPDFGQSYYNHSKVEDKYLNKQDNSSIVKSTRKQIKKKHSKESPSGLEVHGYTFKTDNSSENLSIKSESPFNASLPPLGYQKVPQKVDNVQVKERTKLLKFVNISSDSMDMLQNINSKNKKHSDITKTIISFKSLNCLKNDEKDGSALLVDKSTMSSDHQCALINPSTGKKCLKCFSRPYDLIRHQETIHAEKKKIFKCIICEENYNEAVRNFIDNSHVENDLINSNSSKKIHSPKTFSRGDALSRHIRVKHGLVGSSATEALKYAKDHVELV